MADISDKNYADISKTAFKMLLPRVVAGIPYSTEIFNEALKIFPRGEKGPNTDIKAAVGYEARYRLIDKMLLQSGMTQVLELGAGFSPRGLTFAQSRKDSVYAELELPAMAEMKRGILGAVAEVPENLHVVDGNALRPQSFFAATEFFDPGRPIAVICEGLLRYLTFKEKEAVAYNVLRLLKKFGGVWITCDITLAAHLEDGQASIPGYDAKLSRMSGKKFETRAFADVESAVRFFKKLDLDMKTVPFTEMLNELVSPEKIGCAPDETVKLIKHNVVGILRVRAH